METSLIPSNFLIYTTPDGKTKLEVRLEDGNIWLNQEQIAMLYGLQRPAITKHINHIFVEGELEESVVCSILELTTQHGAIPTKTQQQKVKFYNLDMIIAVGYRVKSPVGTRFRQWATDKIHTYLQKGFVMDDERLKNLGGGLYRKELLERIRLEQVIQTQKLLEKKIKNR